jgi:hypothetical protein
MVPGGGCLISCAALTSTGNTAKNGIGCVIVVANEDDRRNRAHLSQVTSCDGIEHESDIIGGQATAAANGLALVQ